jgi:GNAT superfamily N-acetyltransferase
MEVNIVEYTPEYRTAFKALNEEWISAYFKMEDSDFKALDNAEEYILNRGGFILVALYDNVPAGVCALIRMDDPEYDYEMAKMAVSPAMQGKGIGWQLGQAIISKAKAAGGKNLYLESNTILAPAIKLYEKLGFQRIEGRATPYQRCNIQMKLAIV